jgi:peptide/nickel transport system substrate-binding protein
VIRTLSCVLAAALLVAATGCSRESAGSSRDTLVIAVAAEPATLNSLLLEGPTDAMVGSLIYSYLVTDGPNGKPVPDVAKVIPTLANGGISHDGLRIVYRLRHDVRWQDGVKLTAQDCVFTYHAILNPHSAIPSRYGYEGIVKSVTALDDYTLELTLTHPLRSAVSGFLALDGNYPIMPKHLLERYPSLDRLQYNIHPVGSGPFRVVDWVHGDHLTLAANPLYFRGAPHIASVRIDFVPNSMTMLNELRTGEIEAAFDVDPSLYQEARGIPGSKLVLTPITGMGSIVFNTEQGPTADQRVRQAIASGIDNALVVERSSHGVFLPRSGRRAVLGLAAGETQVPPFNPARARALLDAAGWRTGADGVRVKDGRPLTLTLITSPAEPMSSTIVTMVQAQLRSLGVDARIRMYAPAMYKAPAPAGGPIFSSRFSMAYLLITVGGDGDLAFLYECTQRPPSGFDISRVCDRRIDAAANAGEASFDPAVVSAANAKLENALEQDVPEIVLYQPQRVSLFKEDLRGFSPSTVSPYTGSWRWAK